MSEEKSDSDLENEMFDLGYCNSNEIQLLVVDDVKKHQSIEQIAALLYKYAYGSAFMHSEAYKLCSIANYWPTFVRHPEHLEYVMDFSKFISAAGNQDYHQKFEDVFVTNRDFLSNNGEVNSVQRNFRLKVCMGAAKALGIDWKDIKKNK